MGIALKCGSITTEIGTSDFLNSFFSTICIRLENSEWASRFPCVMINLYQGRLESNQAEVALGEIRLIKQELSNFPPDQVVWDADDLSKKPPWGNTISSEIYDLSQYFVTSNGLDLITELEQTFKEQKKLSSTVEIISY